MTSVLADRLDRTTQAEGVSVWWGQISVTFGSGLAKVMAPTPHYVYIRAPRGGSTGALLQSIAGPVAPCV